MFELKSFCGCLTIKEGVLIVGSFIIIDLLIHCIQFQLGNVLRLFTSMWFFAILYKDSKWNRFGLFASFATQVALKLTGMLTFYLLVETKQERKEDICDESPDDKKLECLEFFENKFVWVYALYTLVLHIALGFQVLVLYQHYINSEKPRTQGGLREFNLSETEM